MLKVLLGENPFWSTPYWEGLHDWSGITVGKKYLLDEDGVTFRDDKGSLRTVDAWLFQVEPTSSDPTQNPDPLVNPKKAAGAVKAPMHTLPPLPLVQANNVMAGGNHKYGLYNYRDSQVDAMTYIGAINRHFMLWQDGEDNDQESSQSHLAHIISDCAILLDCLIRGQLIDNRKKTGLLAKELEKSKKTFQQYTNDNLSLEERNAS